MKQRTFYQIFMMTYFFLVTLAAALVIGILLKRVHYYSTLHWSALTLTVSAAILYFTRTWQKKFVYFVVKRIWKEKPYDWQTFLDETEVEE